MKVEIFEIPEDEKFTNNKYLNKKEDVAYLKISNGGYGTFTYAMSEGQLMELNENIISVITKHCTGE